MAKIQAALQGAEKGTAPVEAGEAKVLIERADRLIADAKTLASESTAPPNICS